MPFDLVLFNCGLKSGSSSIKEDQWNLILQYYKIANYQDLAKSSVGCATGIFRRSTSTITKGSYVVMETIEFYMWKSKPLIEYIFHAVMVLPFSLP